MNKRGYTLVELLVCLAILGLLTGIATAPLFGKQRSRQLLSSTIIGLSNDLRAARFAAMKEGRPYCVEIYTTNYTVSAQAPGQWEIIKRVYWPKGITRVGTLYVKLSFPASGLFKEVGNNRVTLKDDHGHQMEVIISGGGRIRIE